LKRIILQLLGFVSLKDASFTFQWYYLPDFCKIKVISVDIDTNFER